MSVAGNKLDIFQTAQTIKQSINEVFNEHDEILPQRQFIYVGEEPPHDCEQLVIGFIQHYSGAPGAQAQAEERCDSPRTAVFRVELVRSCAPSLSYSQNKDTGRRYSNRQEVPSPEDYEADAQKKLIDATLLMESGMRVVDTTFVGGMADVQVGPVSGGFQAMILNIVIVVE